jgi:methionyl-tRNA formyltransferase
LKLVEVTDSANLPELINLEVAVAPGKVVRLDQVGTPAGIGTAQGVLGLKTVQLEGRSPTAAAEFLKGYPQFIGSQL